MSGIFNGSTSKVVTTLATSSTVRTWVGWIKATSSGGGTKGRIFDQENDMLVFFDSGTTNLLLVRGKDTVNGEWTVPAPALSTLAHIIIEYTYGSAPLVWVDGVSQTVTVRDAGTGSETTSALPLVIGASDSVAPRNWDGEISEFAVFNTSLSADSRALLAAGEFATSLDEWESLVLYTPLVDNVHEYINDVDATATDITYGTHPIEAYGGSGSYPLTPNFINLYRQQGML